VGILGRPGVYPGMLAESPAIRGLPGAEKSFLSGSFKAQIV
jgi:hypothetical protein